MGSSTWSSTAQVGGWVEGHGEHVVVYIAVVAVGWGGKGADHDGGFMLSVTSTMRLPCMNFTMNTLLKSSGGGISQSPFCTVDLPALATSPMAVA
eukprot:353583-Chlamydomonas_euryale.AAC.1